MSTDYSKFNFLDPTEKEEESSPSSFTKFDSFNFTDSSGPDLSELSYAERAGYGAAQETTIGGNIFRMAKAAVQAGTSDKSWSEALEEMEKERQREIDEMFPEFRGLEESEEDLAILSGRLGVAVADPVTFAIPWMKVAKTGSVGARVAKVGALGAGVAVGDTALREKVVYGDVSPSSLAIAATAGSAGSVLGLGAERLIARRLNKGLEDIQPSSPVETPTDLSTSEISAVESSIKSAASKKDYNTRQTTARIRLLDEYNQAIQGIDDEILKIDARILEVNKSEKVVFDSEKLLKDFKKNKKELKEKRKVLKDKFAVDAVQLAQQKTNLHIDALQELAESENFSDKAASAILTELTKPMFGATSGALYGLSTRDDANDIESVYVSAAVGAGLGVAYKRISDSDAITTEIKDSVKMAINKAGFNYNRMNLKTLFSTGVATKMDSYGGWNKAIGNMLFSRFGQAADSVESRTLKGQSEWVGRVNEILKDSGADDNVLDAAGEAMFDFIPEDKLVGWQGLTGARQALTEEQAREVKRIVPLLREAQDSIKDRITKTGIDFEDLDFYGMSLRFNLEDTGTDLGKVSFKNDIAEAVRIHNKNITDETKKIGSADKYSSKILGENQDKIGKYDPKLGSSPFSYDGETNSYKFRPLAEYFEIQRRLTDPEAIRYLARKGRIITNARDVLSDYGSSSIKIAEFAETFGAKGEIINTALRETREAMKGTGRVGDKYTDQLIGGVEAFWGRRTKGIFADTGEASQEVNDFFRIFTTLANTSYPTLVTFSNLVDLTQPFLKSGFGASTKALMQKGVSRLVPTKKLELGGKSFAEMSNFQYDKSFERELETLLKARTITDNSRIAKGTSWVNNQFFKLVQLKNVTSVARKFAYDAGVNRAFALAKKYKKSGKRSKVFMNELKDLDLTIEDLNQIGRYSTVEEAFEEANARNFLDVAGRRAAERDSIIPNVGNRLLFSQTNAPITRSVGQFLSWSQAKSSELNAMLSRIEDGDTKLLLRLAASIPIYVGFEELRQKVSGLPDYYDKKEKNPDIAADVARGLERTGLFSNFQTNFLLDTVRYTFNSNEFSVGDNLSPALSFVNDLVKAGFAASDDAAVGDTEGAFAEILSEVPPAKQIMSATKALTGRPLLEDEPNETKERGPLRFKKGGEVDIERAASEPDERIDKMTGMPYDQQAGTAFVDEEDPLRRMGFGRGGEVDPLKRMGFGGML